MIDSLSSSLLFYHFPFLLFTHNKDRRGKINNMNKKLLLHIVGDKMSISYAELYFLVFRIFAAHNK
jgi:hypothetical protein